MKLTGENRRTRGKTCPIATLSTTNPTWTDLGSNPSLRGERPAANRQSHGTALRVVTFTTRAHYPRRVHGTNGIRHWVNVKAALGRSGEGNAVPLPGNEPRFLGGPARSLVTIPTELSRLPS
jgi:hypothetical protein